jgi:heme A synthase
MITSASITTTDAPGSGLRRPFWLATCLVGVTILTIVMGALTTSTDSGMAFEDWPLSDGQLMPVRSYTQLDGFLEHFHRLIAAGAGLLSIALVVAVFRNAAASPLVRKLSVVGLVLICVQGTIGGLGVLKELPRYNSATHGTLAQVVLSIAAVCAYLLSERRARTTAEVTTRSGSARKVSMLMLLLLIMQTFIGAVARHSPPGEGAHALWTHVGNSVVVFLVVIIALGITARLSHIPGIQSVGRWGMGLLMVQIALGFVALLVRRGKHPENIEYLWRASLISTHVLVGALLTCTAAVLVAHVRCGTRSAAPRG